METSPLSQGQPRSVDSHEDEWWDRLTSLTVRAVRPMRSPQPRAHPSPPSVSLLSPPLARSGFRHLDGYHTRRRSPPAGFATDRGRGSNPRGGTAAWTPPRRREAPHGLTEGGLLPVAPTGGASCLAAPRAPHLTSTTTRAHACPDIISLGDHTLTPCSACPLVGAAPVSRPL